MWYARIEVASGDRQILCSHDEKTRRIKKEIPLAQFGACPERILAVRKHRFKSDSMRLLTFIGNHSEVRDADQWVRYSLGELQIGQVGCASRVRMLVHEFLDVAIRPF